MDSISPRRDTHELEMQISAAASHKAEEAFGDAAHEIQEQDPLYQTVDTVVADLVKEFPPAPNGSRYINTFCVITPKLIVNYSKLKPLFKKQQKENLFLDEKGKTITFGPLCDPVLGNITTDNISLKLKNIRLIKGSALRPNEHAKKGTREALSESKTILLNKNVTIGYVNRDPNIKKTEILADVKFGELLNSKNQHIELQGTDSEETTELTIQLPALCGKVEPDGSIALSNGITLTAEQLEELIGPGQTDWINHTFEIDAPFVPEE